MRIAYKNRHSALRQLLDSDEMDLQIFVEFRLDEIFSSYNLTLLRALLTLGLL
jgi:hypothetical protein